MEVKSEYSEQLIFIPARCYLFPTRVLYSTIHAAEEYIDMFPAYYIFNCLLIILQFLNVMWTVLILRVPSDITSILL